MVRRLQILGSGKYLPKRIVYSTEIDAKLGLASGTVEDKSGVHERHFVDGETLVDMGVQAAKRALDNAEVDINCIDLIISAGGVMQQPVPCTAALLQDGLGLHGSGIPSFDINSTCLSFVTALDTVSYFLEAGTYKTALIISADIASCGIDWEHLESACLFGDGAAAFVVQRTPEGIQSGVISSLMETYSEGSSLCEIKGGLSRMVPQVYHKNNPKDYLFHMEGREVFKLSAKHLPQFVSKVLEPAHCTLSDCALIVPHQASASSMALMQRKLKIPDEKLMWTIKNHGNTIASSIPIALHEAIEQRRICRGDFVMLIGTSAGVSLGSIILKY